MLRKKVATRQLKVVFEPDGPGWHVFIPAVSGCRSHGRSIAEARKHIREALALCEEEFSLSDLRSEFPNAARCAATIEFVEDVRVPKTLRQAVDRALRARKQAEQKDAEAAQSAVDGAKALRRAGLSLRDAGELLQLSHQRIKQLTEA